MHARLIFLGLLRWSKGWEKNPNLCGVEEYGCFLQKPPSCTLSSRPVRESTVLLRLPAGEELRSSRAPLENTVANVNHSLVDVPEEEGKRRFNGIFLLNK